ncbi:PfATPase-related protein [Trichomonas vaginalis G3]|uniref:PfATPase-related protein n=1 Tax=Trichomonas vaginalis (strain ATCC PRA-98 / G3) TaxID=412133 RepID=A2HBI5_TRIV3|nr:PfATPase-related protein [Trichomonas vaginalis G3]|eukprot:XP_001286162.1 PfATPase-related protein [Trichomonas vaginalis G3]
MDTDTGMHQNQHNNHLHNQHNNNNQHNNHLHNQHSNQQFKTLHNNNHKQHNNHLHNQHSNNNHKQSKDIKEVENKETKNS